MSVNRVVFVVESPFSARDEKRFGTAVLKSMGYEVEIWDVSLLVLPLSRQQWREAPRLVAPRVIKSSQEFRLLAQSLTRDDACILMSGLDVSQSESCHVIRSELLASPALLCAISSGHLPEPSGTQVFFTEVQQLLGQPSRLIPATSARTIRALKKVGRGLGGRRQVGNTKGKEGRTRELDIVWAGTNVSNLNPSLLGPKTEVRFIHTLDYDQLLNMEFKAVEEGRYCVFVDSMGPMHPDFYTHQLVFPMTMERYSAVVRHHISAIERLTGLPVVVAAHPRAEPTATRRWYGGREVFFGRTVDLIAESRLVLAASDSTALGIAAVTKRPISLVSGLTLPRETELYLRAFIRELRLTRASRITPDSSWSIPQVNAKAYARYVERYVKRPGTPRRPFWEVVGDDLLRV